MGEGEGGRRVLKIYGRGGFKILLDWVTNILSKKTLVSELAVQYWRCGGRGGGEGGALPENILSFGRNMSKSKPWTLSPNRRNKSINFTVQ